MSKTARWLVLGVLWGSLSASAHLCNNIYRTPDRLIVKPEKQVAEVDQSDQFRIFVQNNYQSYIDHVRLTATIEGGDGVTAEITPNVVDRLNSGQRVAFTLRLTVKDGTPAGKCQLKLKVSADQIGFRPVSEPTEGDLLKESEDGNHSGAMLACEALARLKNPKGVEKLRGFCQREKSDWRGRAIRAMGRTQDPGQIEFLRQLLTERDGWVRGNTLLALGLLKDQPATFQAQVDDRDEFVQAAAWAGLALAGQTGGALDGHLKAGLTSTNPYVRIACGWALAAMRHDKAGVDVLDAAFRTPDAQQRVTAGDALVDVAARQSADGKG
jgi:hypothetical protein